MKMNDGGPAFPRPFSKDEHARFPDEAQKGMSLRDYFAAKAMQGLVLATQTMTHVTVSMVADEAYEYADAMLKAREK